MNKGKIVQVIGPVVDVEFPAPLPGIYNALTVDYKIQGQPTKLVDVVKAADVARLTQEDWQRERDKMIKTCNQCHSVNFAKQQLQQGDDMTKNADHLMAEAIHIVADLYKDGVLPKPANYAYPTVVEQKLFVMYLEHRMRTFQGTFHASPHYTLWYGWSEMQRDLTEIKELSAQMRREKRGATLKPAIK